MATQYVGRNPQQQILKNKQDIEELQKKPIVGIEQITVNNESEADVTVDDNGILCFNMRTEINDGATSIDNVTTRLPIRGKTGIVLDASDNGKYAEIGIDQSTYYVYRLTVLPTTVSGILPADIVSALSAAQTAVITFNKENYYKCDNQHTAETLVFSHTGYESGLIRVKTITITIRSRGWVLSTPVIPDKYFYCAIDLLGELYYTSPIPVALGNYNSIIRDIDIFKWYNQEIHVSGVFKYGSEMYSISWISFDFNGQDDTIANGGTVYCQKLSDGTTTALQFTSTQLFFAANYRIDIPNI